MNISELLITIEQNPQSFSFLKAYELHINSINYKPYQDLTLLHEEISTHLKSKNDVKVIENAYKILKLKPFDIESHALINQAASRLNKQKIASIHNFIASSLLDILINSGDGKSFDNAYKIYFPEDEMALFTYLKIQPIKREYLDQEHKHFDLYTLKNKDEIIFDISIPFNSLVNQES